MTTDQGGEKRTGKDVAQDFADIHLASAALKRYGLPDIDYRVPVADLEALRADDAELPLATLLHGLQQRNRGGEARWQLDEPAMDRLAELIAAADGREGDSAAGEHWWLEVGPVDLDAELVTVQRGRVLIAAIARRDDGRLRVAVFRPLDAKSAGYLTGMARLPHPEYGVNMRENNWEYALDCSAGTGNAYAADAGQAYLSYWERGLGMDQDGAELTEWREQASRAVRPIARVVAELGVHDALSRRRR